MTSILRKENCEVVLENYLKCKNFQIENFQVDSLASKVSGMMAEYYLLKIIYKFENNTHTKTFFCKKLEMFHKIQQIMGKAQGAFEKEDYMYKLIKQCNEATKFQSSFSPECYLSIKDDIFVLDDLEILGYSIHREKHDLNHCKLALKAVADFHATSIIYEETQSLKSGKKFSLYEENPEVFNDSLYRRDENYLGRKWFKNCFSTILKIADICKLPNIDNNKLKTKIELYADKVYDIIQPSKNFVNVVCHGDLSPVNILFKYDENKLPSDCKLVDFQALRYTPPAHDVMNYIYLNTEFLFRKKHINELLEYYHKTFHLELEKYSIDKERHIILKRFHESCEYVLPQVILQTAFYATMMPMNLHFPEMKKDQELYKKYVYEDRSLECLEIYKKGGLFSDIVNEMFKELYAL